LSLAYKDPAKRAEEQEERGLMEGSQDGSFAEQERINSAYIKSFCSGVQEVLQLYQSQLQLVEHEYLTDRSMSVITL